MPHPGNADPAYRVTVSSHSVPSPGEEAEGDGRGEWGIQGGHELFRTEKWAGGVMANYDGDAYFHESEFDLAYVGAGAWVDRTLDERTHLRIQPLSVHAGAA